MRNNICLKTCYFSAFIIVFSGIIFSCSTARFSQNKIPYKTDSLYVEIEKLGQELTLKNKVPGVAVAVIRDGKIAWIVVNTR
ncbi:CubicO group peptidase (beta-lactamase class C family) [Chryseobacterium sp. SORGH_AS 447]|nr:CubicO group peptidase (beta-lactamase class C family) [Chryseobacterium sp. SORGH_AS_0447]